MGKFESMQSFSRFSEVNQLYCSENLRWIGFTQKLDINELSNENSYFSFLQVEIPKGK